MSLDDEVRGYERALAREGRDPRDVGARLLGADPGRFLLLVMRAGDYDEPPHRMSDEIRGALTDDECRRFVRVTLTWRFGGAAVVPRPKRWQAAWALPVVTIQETVPPLTLWPGRMVVWDRALKSALHFLPIEDETPDDVTDGWREPRDSPEPPALTVRAGSNTWTISTVASICRDCGHDRGAHVGHALERACAVLGCVCRLAVWNQ